MVNRPDVHEALDSKSGSGREETIAGMVESARRA
jgi:hypothetical protein